ncbi:TPA: hypothetical protein DDY55_04975 [Candidatus Falkowbacteria bacterium]|nr:hypothetical protein [Candidatus Falkowbacteria bacterium]HAY12807.1 hypothetical protein [Candidatus Falkowbacteria bacterium]HBI97438.1 hypothetical protein [Candidatus Falkowbacteria bacterium]HBT27329.1 hypothetical protein [Candidatus Falkowbacteria bacterium]HBY15482.1 hypothetical protein [Candidatus Falkowbacteria bacterium]
MQWQLDVERRRFKGTPEHFASYVLGLATTKFLEMNSSLQSFKNVLKPEQKKLTIVDSEK